MVAGAKKQAETAAAAALGQAAAAEAAELLARAEQQRYGDEAET